MRDVRDRLGATSPTPGVRCGVGEDAVDRRQQRLRRAERQVERHASPRQPRLPGAGGERLAHLRRTWWAPRPGSRRSTASRRRRRTACAPPRARRRPRRTLPPARGSPATAPGSCPAPRRRGCGRARRRACRAPIRPPPTSASRLAVLGHQIVEVERRAPRLGVAVALQHGVAEPDQRHRRIEQGELAPLRVERQERAWARCQQRMRVRMRGHQLLWSAGSCAPRRSW